MLGRAAMLKRTMGPRRAHGPATERRWLRLLKWTSPLALLPIAAHLVSSSPRPAEPTRLAPRESVSRAAPARPGPVAQQAGGAQPPRAVAAGVRRQTEEAPSATP